MTESPQLITLSGADCFLTENPGETYRLVKGCVSVFIVPMEKGRPGPRLHYCTIRSADSRRTIPALVYRDRDYKNWRLLLVSTGEEDAVLAVIPGRATSVLQKSFLARNNLDSFAQEGFEQSLADFYTLELLQQNAYIHKLNTPASEGRDDSLYNALRYLCGKTGMTLVPREELVLRCGQDPDVPDIAAASGFLCRRVVLDPDWYRGDCGALIGRLEEDIVACVPDSRGKYLLYRPKENKTEPLTAHLARKIDPEAWSVGRTLPARALTWQDLLRFCRAELYLRDLLPYVLLVLLCALIGILLPTVTGMIYDDYIPVGNIPNLTELCLVMLSFMTGNVAFTIVKNLFGYRITSRVGIHLQNAVYHRLFHLPESFFRKYDSADLAGRVSGIGATASRFAATTVITGISALFSIVYLLRMFGYSTKLTWLCLWMYLGYVMITVLLTCFSHKERSKIAKAESDSSGRLFQYLNGVDKLRMAGVEDRALESFLVPYSDAQFAQVRLNRLLSVGEACSTVVKSLFSMVLYWFTVTKMDAGSISLGSFVAFQSAFGMFTGALDGFVAECLELVQETAQIRRFWPVFRAVPEDDNGKTVPGVLSGSISLEHVSFAYDTAAKNVLTDVSVQIRPGEYVGIVGPSGCGKSTLLKLLLGFETPQTGSVIVDRQDLRTLHKGAYRRQLGTVLQNGRLISGSIYENITITAPNADMERVSDVIRRVGLEKDIAKMPMGIHTILSESAGTISGGQQQRILIARAICGNPRILLFDEATSALDNVTQATVSRNLDAMNITRIVVAHRLSTVINCDRILVMDGGRIVEEGNYASLMAKKGLFYQLASRQIAQ